jgi:histidinol phosphatase-like enzyme
VADYEITTKIVFLDIDGVLNGVNLELQQFIDRLPKFINTIVRKFCHRNGGHLPIMPAQTARLKKIINATGTIIVLSSAWRKLLDDPRLANPLYSALADYGLTIESSTGIDPSGWREKEIFAWLADTAKKHGYFGLKPSEPLTNERWAEQDPRAWIAIDDDLQDMQKIDKMGKLIRTAFFSHKFGLQDSHVRKAIDILNNNRKIAQ